MLIILKSYSTLLWSFFEKSNEMISSSSSLSLSLSHTHTDMQNKVEKFCAFIYWCIINYHKFGSIKQFKFTVLKVFWVKSAGFSCSRTHHIEIKVLAESEILSEAHDPLTSLLKLLLFSSLKLWDCSVNDSETHSTVPFITKLPYI